MFKRYRYIVEVNNINELRKVHNIWHKKNPELVMWEDGFFIHTSFPAYAHLSNKVEDGNYVMYTGRTAESSNSENPDYLTFKQFINKFGESSSKYVRQLQFENIEKLDFIYAIKLDKGKAVEQATELHKFWKRKVIDKTDWREDFYKNLWSETYILLANPNGNFNYVMEGSSAVNVHIGDTIDKHIYTFKEFKYKFMTSKYVKQLNFDESINNEILEEEFTEDSVKEQLPKVRIIFNDKEYEGYIRTNTTEFAYVRIEDFPGTKFKFSWETVADSLNKDIPLETE